LWGHSRALTQAQIEGVKLKGCANTGPAGQVGSKKLFVGEGASGVQRARDWSVYVKH